MGVKEGVMNIGVVYADVTEWDVEGISNSFECKKYSAPFFVVSKDSENVVIRGLADGILWKNGQYDDALRKGSVYQRSVPLAVFSARFDLMHIDGRQVDRVCCLKQPILPIAKMEFAFSVMELSEDHENFVRVDGNVGDYLLKGATGLNKVVRSSDYENNYQKTDFDKYFCPSPTIKLALRKMATQKSDHDLIL